jgi:hypothetical protein
LSGGAYAEHLKKVLPSPDDLKILEPIFTDRNWLAAGNA